MRRKEGDRVKGLILAAGRGSRLNSVTKGDNKCLLQVGGKPVIRYTAEHICSLPEITECVVVVGYKAKDVIRCLGHEVNGTSIVYCLQEEQKGLIHAMESAAGVLDGEDFMMILGDEFIVENHYQEAVRRFQSSDCDAMIGIYDSPEIDFVRKTYTFRIDENNYVYDFVEKPQNPFNHLMGTGNVIFRGFTASILEQVPVNKTRGERELVDLFYLLQQGGGKILSFTVGENYINLNTKHDVELLDIAVAKSAS